jgi:NADH dehydrogenase FAD-containing subunit
MATKNIVIVGGGFAGIQLANALEKALVKSNDQEHRIILVEKVNLEKR